MFSFLFSRGVRRSTSRGTSYASTPGQVAARHPRGQVRAEPPDARAATAPPRSAGDHRGVLRRHARGREGVTSELEHLADTALASGRTASAPRATSHAAMPFDLKRTTSSSDCRPAISPETTSCSSCTSSQSSTEAATGSIRSPDSIRACSSQSQHTNVERSRTALSSSRRFATFAPAAMTSAPRASHSPRRTGSRELVIVTTTSWEPASRWLSPPPHRALAKCRESLRCPAVGDDVLDRRQGLADAGDLGGLVTAPDDPERSRSALREMLRGHATCSPGPQTAELVGLDHRHELGCLRIEEANDEGRPFEGRGVELSPARRSPWSDAAMSASAPSAKRSLRRGAISTSPAAMRRRQASIAGTASAGSRRTVTSPSLR